MSRPLTLEQALLSEVDQILTDFSPVFEQRLLVLEACAAKLGGFDIDEYWEAFGITVADRETIISIADTLTHVLPKAGIMPSLVLSSLSREPISISEKKQNGAFYTDFRLAKFVAEDCSASLKRDSKVADIAAGSGILLASVAEVYYSAYPDTYDRWISNDVYAFDLSEYALRGARIALATHASSVEAVRKMCENWMVCDSLIAKDSFFPTFDIVVGNPPWGKVKLSLHSFVNKDSSNYHVYGSQYGDFDQARFLTEKQTALDYGKTLKEHYSLLGNAEPDMYMAFLQKATCLLEPGGHLSYIVPAGLIRSLGTEHLRRFLLSGSSDLKYYLLDNKANFFEIDTRFKFVIVSLQKTHPNQRGCETFALEICKGNNTGVVRTEEVWFGSDELEKIRPDLTIPECRSAAEKDLFIKICSNGQEWREAWSVDIAREVDMTNDRAHFHIHRSDDDIPVIEGRMVQQFRFGAKAYVSGSGRSAKWVPNVGSVKAQFFISPNGYLIVKPGKDKTRYMLGCTNYKKDGTGCSRIMTPSYFFEYMNIPDDEPAPPIVVPKGIDIKPKNQTAAQPTPETQKEVVAAPTIKVPEIKPIEYNGYDLNTTLGLILQTLSDVSQKKYYGATILIDVLRGSQNKRVLSDGLDACMGYGKLVGVKRDDVQFLVEWLIENEYIRQTRGPYPVLHPTYNGEHYSEVITRQKLQALKRKLENTDTAQNPEE